MSNNLATIYNHFKEYDSTLDKIHFLEVYYEIGIPWYKKFYIALTAIFRKEQKNEYILDTFLRI